MISGLDCICYCALFVLLLFIYRCKYFTNEFMLWPIVLGTNHYLFCEKEVIFKENILSFVLRKHKCNASICPLFSYMHFVKFEEKDIFHNNFNKKKKISKQNIQSNKKMVGSIISIEIRSDRFVLVPFKGMIFFHLFNWFHLFFSGEKLQKCFIDFQLFYFSEQNQLMCICVYMQKSRWTHLTCTRTRTMRSLEITK